MEKRVNPVNPQKKIVELKMMTGGSSDHDTSDSIASSTNTRGKSEHEVTISMLFS